MYQIKQRKIEHSINFSLLEIPLPGITPKIGVFDVLKFQFSDTTLMYFSNELSLFVASRNNLDKEKDEIKHSFNVGKSLQRTSINTVLHFIQNFPNDEIDLKIDGINWNLLIFNSIARELIEIDSHGKKVGLTPASSHLLFVCVDNEPEDPKKPWLLEECMKQLLK
jgi:hypothetical protein